jgi:hypothetical protein
MAKLGLWTKKRGALGGCPLIFTWPANLPIKLNGVWPYSDPCQPALSRAGGGGGSGTPLLQELSGWQRERLRAPQQSCLWGY